MFKISPQWPEAEMPRAYVVMSEDGNVWLNGSSTFELKLEDELKHPENSVLEYPIGTMDGSSILLRIVIGNYPTLGKKADDSISSIADRWVSLRSLLISCDEKWFTLLSVARQVVEWEKQHRYCGICGEKTSIVTDNMDRYKYCHPCKHRWYPRISPCVIGVIIKDDSILLAKSVKVSGDWFSALAGFIEPGESVEQALHREVMEEVGLTVSMLQYIGSQSWSFPHQLMIGFLCHYESGEIVIAPDEIAEARWFRYDQLPKVPPSKSISGQLIELAVNEIVLTKSGVK